MMTASDIPQEILVYPPEIKKKRPRRTERAQTLFAGHDEAEERTHEISDESETAKPSANDPA
jgi:hypothetical protein